MKKILFFSLMMVCMFSFGKCNKEKKCCNRKATTEASAKKNNNEVWMRYDETKCDNPWHFNWFAKPTKAQVLAAVKSDLLGKEINILKIMADAEEDLISCEACNCPNGTHFYVRVSKSEIDKLKALKFYEIKDVPDIRVDDNKQ